MNYDVSCDLCVFKLHKESKDYNDPYEYDYCAKGLWKDSPWLKAKIETVEDTERDIYENFKFLTKIK
jgi:hypothetical protein